MQACKQASRPAGKHASTDSEARHSMSRSCACDDFKDSLVCRCKLDRIVRAIVLPDERSSPSVKRTLVASSKSTTSKSARAIAASSAAETSDTTISDEALSASVTQTRIACSTTETFHFARTIAATSAADTSGSTMLLDQYFGLPTASHLFLAKILAHAAYDLSTSSDEFHSKANAIHLQCLSTAPSSIVDNYRKHTVWLTERSTISGVVCV